MAIQVSAQYIATGANHSASCSAAAPDGIVAYGSGKLVSLWDTEHESGVYATLAGHPGDVTKIKYLQGSSSGENKFVSGDTTGQVRVWRETTRGQYSCAVTFDAHASDSISALGIGPSDSPLANHILVGCADGSVKLWKLDEDRVTSVQKLDIKGKLPLDFEMALLPGCQSVVLAIGCTDKRIQLWLHNDSEFELATMLEGHENWIRALSFTTAPGIRSQSVESAAVEDLMLASGSQDHYIRLWRISATLPPKTARGGLEALDELEEKLGEGSLSTTSHLLHVKHRKASHYFNVTLEALLIGHESGVTNVHWHPAPPSSSHSSPRPLLSTSMDNSMVIWEPSSAGIWVPEHRFGSLGGHKMGLFGGLWGKKGKSVCCSGWTGGWERWIEGKPGVWDVRAGVTGHFGEVKSVTWDQDGNYLLSVSSDQTSRIHACIPSEAGPSTWAEIARPQIHGYDMTDVSFISPLRFISTADEKVARVFDAPGGFVESLGAMGIVQNVGDTTSRPRGATVPPLGLSNRALGKEAMISDHPAPRVPHEARDAVSETLRSKPTEEVLAMSTLWPEIEKVYGHGYELVNVATSHDGKFVATACKASSAEHAVVRLNSTETWDEFGRPLAGHTLTVTRIAFREDDEIILTCSRDRGWTMFKRDARCYIPWAKEEKAHSRMILDTCWIDKHSFATASRDKTVKIWRLTEDGATLQSTIKLEEGATAVHCARGLLAVGLETGIIEIYRVSDAESEPSLRIMTHKLLRISHVGPLNRLCWNPHKPLLASCSDDKSVRIFAVQSHA
ncbi:elongator protein [Kockovaella imperatae]|uniref:Elongator complex protein 2 n=1 Tax=Kockovaella imperatae TaxID=4999 RepID=A0A1Y1U8F9_9TREE|nr:elongator protein [Kockovaella imperatae]ORX33777.1 elongator protein [Kockovaella imperatae]